MEENKMAVMPVNKLLISMALPMMISMLVQALYNIVDSMFVAQISENADGGFSGVSCAEPDDCCRHRYRCWYQCTGFPFSWGKKRANAQT